MFDDNTHFNWFEKFSFNFLILFHCFLSFFCVIFQFINFIFFIVFPFIHNIFYFNFLSYKTFLILLFFVSKTFLLFRKNVLFSAKNQQTSFFALFWRKDWVKHWGNSLHENGKTPHFAQVGVKFTYVWDNEIFHTYLSELEKENFNYFYLTILILW